MGYSGGVLMNVGSATQFGVDQLAQLVRLLQSGVVGSRERVDHPRIGTALLVGNADINGGPSRDFVQGGLIGERLGADDGGTALGVKRDELQPGLDVARDMLDRGQSAPGDDLFDVLRLVQSLLDRGVPALPVADRQVFGDRVIGGHVRESAGDRKGGQRVVGGGLDDRVAAGDDRAQDGDRGNQAAVAGRDVQYP